MTKMRLTLLLPILVITMASFAQNRVERVEPPCWWVGMNNPNLQLLVYGQNIASATVSINYPSVDLLNVEKVENPNYLFINLLVKADAKPGMIDIKFTFPKGKPATYRYELKSRQAGSANRKGFDNSDVVYLVYPDRFSNGNPSNDSLAGYPDKVDRNEPYARHGGDIQGIMNHLDYFSNLGVTALWLNPVLESNQPSWSYHAMPLPTFTRLTPVWEAMSFTRILLIKLMHKVLR